MASTIFNTPDFKSILQSNVVTFNTVFICIVFRLVPKLSGYRSIYINSILSLASCFMVANRFFPGNWLFVLPFTPPPPVPPSHPLPPSWPHRFPCHTCRTPRNWKANEASVIIIMRASKSAHYDNNSVPNAWPVGFFRVARLPPPRVAARPQLQTQVESMFCLVFKNIWVIWGMHLVGFGFNHLLFLSMDA